MSNIFPSFVTDKNALTNNASNENKRIGCIFFLRMPVGLRERDEQIYCCLQYFQGALFELTTFVAPFDNAREYSDVSLPMVDRCHVFPIRDISDVLIY